MGVGGMRRLLAALVLIVALPFGSEAWAQACSTLNGTSTALPAGAGLSRASNVVTQTPGDTVTVTITGAVGGSGTISFGNGSVAWAGPGTYMVTNTASSPSTLVAITGNGGTGGTASFMCGATSSTSTNSAVSPGVQNANRAFVTAQVANQSTTFQGTAIATNVVTSLTPSSSSGGSQGPGGGVCPTCGQIRAQIERVNGEFVLAESLMASAEAGLKALLGQQNALIASMNAAEARGDTKAYESAKSNLRITEDNLAAYRGNVARGKQRTEELAKQLNQLRLELRLAEAAAGMSSAPLPHSEWRQLDTAQSLMPRQSLRASIPEQAAPDLLAFDDRPKTQPAAGGFKINRDDLVQLAQRPDGSNSLREALTGQWNVWAEGRFTGSTDSVVNTSSIGFVGSLGADYKFMPWLTGGLSMGFETAQTKTGAPGGGINAFGISAVPYVGVRLDPHLFASAFFGITGLSYNATPVGGVNAAYSGKRLFGGGTLTGVWQEGPWRLQPAASITYGQEAQTAYTDSAGNFVPGQTVPFGRAWAGPEVGYTFRDPGNAWSVEPFVRGQFNVDFATNQQLFTNGLLIATRSGISGTLAGGVSWQTGTRFNGRLEGSYDSLGISGLDLWSAMFRFTWAF